MWPALNFLFRRRSPGVFSFVVRVVWGNERKVATLQACLLSQEHTKVVSVLNTRLGIGFVGLPEFFVEIVVFESGNNVVMVVKRMLISGRFIVLDDGYAVAVAHSLERIGNQLRHFHDPMSNDVWEVVDIFVMRDWHYEWMSFITFDEFRTHNRHDEFVTIENISLLDPSRNVFGASNSEADWACVVFGRVNLHRISG